MKVLLVNKFFYLRGGDTRVFFSRAKLLKKNGHDVSFFSMLSRDNPDTPYSDYFVSNIDFNAKLGLLGNLKAAGRALYSYEARNKISRLIRDERPDIAHLHNICHHLSPSIIDALKTAGVPVVMTLHDYKLVCPAYSMLSRGVPCERCKQGKYYHCFFRKCTKGSALKSLLNTIEMYLHHRFLHIYDKVDVYISPSRFLVDKVREMGFSGKVVCLPNYIDISEHEPSYDLESNSIVYVGRLSEEKGVDTLIDAVRGLDIELKIIGDGPMRNELQRKVAGCGINNVRFLGFLNGPELQSEVKKSIFAVSPSRCYENSPNSVLEAFALGKPVVGARIGGIPELVIDGFSGLTFEPGNAADLREKIESLVSDESLVSLMGRNARDLVRKNHSPATHYTGLMDIYNNLL